MLARACILWLCVSVFIGSLDLHVEYEETIAHSTITQMAYKLQKYIPAKNAISYTSFSSWIHLCI